MSVQSAVKQMFDALSDAKNSLDLAQKQVVFYEAQVIQITQAYEAVSAILPPDSLAAPTTAKRGRKPAKAGHKSNKSEFPSTPAEFWLGLITSTPQKTTGILSAAAAKLAINENDADKMAVLKPRMASNLANLIAEKKISSKGDRRDRQYFL